MPHPDFDPRKWKSHLIVRGRRGARRRSVPQAAGVHRDNHELDRGVRENAIRK